LKEILKQAQEVIRIEAEAVQGLLERLNDNFVQAIEMLLACRGRVVVTGIGKSGLVGRKIVATLTSTGTPAFFLHPVEGLHGDLGMVTSADVLIAISNSGETSEIIHLLPSVKKIGAKIITLTGCPTSTLAQNSQIVIDAGVEREACPLGLAPTSSTTVALVIGDALAVALMRQRNFGKQDFALFHPGGTLGERLQGRIQDILLPVTNFPLLSEQATVAEFLAAMNKHEKDFALVLRPDGTLAGTLLNRDLCRGDLSSPDFLRQPIDKIMNPNSPVVEEDASLESALQSMLGDNLVAIPVLNKEGKLKGIVTLKDLLTRGDRWGLRK
jgi:arabinose-5-phosphate isomerase